mmetsp:Transcript_14020/g.24847  ORF Transcript_14020/g.24847 Transcript_14020/m.24847 type:complete len:207 (-) Transcript_14020:420-1040(-)
MYGSGDATRFRIVDTIPGCVRGIAHHDAAKCFFTEFPTLFVGDLGENGAAEDAELGGVGHRRRKECEGDAPSRSDRATVRAVAKVYNSADSTRPHGVGNGHVVEHRRCIVPDGAPGTFGLAEHVVGVWGRELYPDAEVCAHLASDSSFKHRVRVKFEDRCERARLGVMAGMQVFDVQEDGFQFRTCVVFRLKEPHPHVVGVVVDDE